jgi:hypothetical protein
MLVPCVLAVANLLKEPVYCMMHILFSINRIGARLGNLVSRPYFGLVGFAPQEAIAT